MCFAECYTENVLDFRRIMVCPYPALSAHQSIGLFLKTSHGFMWLSSSDSFTSNNRRTYSIREESISSVGTYLFNKFYYFLFYDNAFVVDNILCDCVSSKQQELQKRRSGYLCTGSCFS